MQALAGHMEVTLFGFEGALPPLVSWKQGVRKVFFAYCTHLIPHGGVKGWWATASCSQESKLVLIAVRVHPFPSRTRKLSSLAPKILVWRRTGKIGNANTSGGSFFLRHASLAQSVEHAAVNRGVVGSSPTGGAIASFPGRPGAYTAYGNRRWAFSSVG